MFINKQIKKIILNKTSWCYQKNMWGKKRKTERKLDINQV